MVDDMGYSDLGCYGGEIPTPNLDNLAKQGVRFTHFCNTGRSCPSRASLLTGLYPQQAGIGMMSEDPHSAEDHGVHGYMGFLNRNCVTMAEVLKEAGYHTYMAGKWHVGMHGQEKWPLQRGFDHFYGILSGASSYLRPHGDRNLTLDNQQLPPPDQPYYTTDAFTDYALKFVDERPKDGKPYFLYLAYNAPHWPLHAKQADIDKFVGKYRKGWQKIREARMKRMIKMGLIDKSWGLAQWEGRQWDELTEEEQIELDRRMAVYAAQVHCMDYNVGRLFNSFREIIQLLICISKFYVQFITDSFNSFSDRIMKCIFDILTNDKYYFIKSGLYCIMNGIIHNDLPIWAYRFQLLNSAAKTRTHSCSHDD